MAQCLKMGINCIAITDHNTIAGAVKMKEIAPFPVIVGEEVLTLSGEVMGLFLSEEIPRGLPAQEVIARIRAQGGLVNIPHPFDPLRLSLNLRAVQELLPQIDLIEVFNSRSSILGNSSRAKLFARKYQLPAIAGSDAHTLGEIGNAYVEMPEFNGRDEFLRALTQAKIFGHRANLWVHLESNLARLRSKFFR